MSLVEKVRSLEFELFVTRKQLDRTSTSKLDNMLNVWKSTSDKIGLGIVESVSTSVITPTKFVPVVSIPKLEVMIPKEEVLAIRISVVFHFCGGARHTRPNCFMLQATKQATKQKVSVPKA